jgi:hypothetical protein
MTFRPPWTVGLYTKAAGAGALATRFLLHAGLFQFFNGPRATPIGPCAQ